MMRLILAIAIVHIGLLSLRPDTQITSLLLCLRITAFSMACFQDTAKLINDEQTIWLLGSNTTNTLLAFFFLCVQPNSTYLVTLEWTMLVADLLIVCIALYTSLQTEILVASAHKQALTAKDTISNFLISGDVCHHSN
jgi:hypothetical protein